VNPVAVAALKPDIATENDVTAWLGAPTFVTPLPDGNRMFIYSQRVNAPGRPDVPPNSGPFTNLAETAARTVPVLIGPGGRGLSAASGGGATPARGAP
jgi:hypothetical protein